jgi:large subunit ribosomal protein L10
VALNLEQKKALVTDLSEIARRAHSAIGADYTGLTVADMTELRRNARNAGVYLRVVRNNLARRALQETDFACMCDGLVGPVLLAFSEEDPGAAARVMTNFAKSNDKLVVKLVSMGGKLLEPGAIASLAKLPTREQALGSLMAVMKAPISRLICTLAEPHAKLVRTMGAVRDQKKIGLA